MAQTDSDDSEKTAEDLKDELPLDIFLESYTYLGKDAEGFHHHADKSEERIIVCDVGEGERVGKNDWYVRIDPEIIDHVHYDPCFEFGTGLEEWANHVEGARGWENRELETLPGLMGTLDAVDESRA